MLLVEIIAIVFVICAAVLLLHHGWHHSYDDIGSNARQESCVQVCYFQIPDICNHETWILILLTNALSLGVIGPALCLAKA